MGLDDSLKRVYGHSFVSWFPYSCGFDCDSGIKWRLWSCIGSNSLEQVVEVWVLFVDDVFVKLFENPFYYKVYLDKFYLLA